MKVTKSAEDIIRCAFLQKVRFVVLITLRYCPADCTHSTVLVVVIMSSTDLGCMIVLSIFNHFQVLGVYFLSYDELDLLDDHCARGLQHNIYIS